MTTVIETLGDYHTYLSNIRHIKNTTLRRIDLTLREFCEVFGTMETTQLIPTDIDAFYTRLRNRVKKKRNGNGEYTPLAAMYIHKAMTHIRSYVKWLMDKGYLKSLVAADVPLHNAPRPLPKFLAKQELGQILNYLEEYVAWANNKKAPRFIYAAYMWRALVWMLYTTGLRNFELRSLTYADINMENMSGVIL
ncbi:MAG TPA: hypothetical protein VK588_01710 [Chitinophagaceae bacterium]|nr:hypothetical protein [Chitinophagaceae bacterium]